MKLLFSRRVLATAAVLASLSASRSLLVTAQNSTNSTVEPGEDPSLVPGQNSTEPPAATEDPYDFIDDEGDGGTGGGSGSIADIVGSECEDVAIVYASCFFNNQAACLESCNTTASDLGAAENTVGDVAAGATCADIQEPTCTFAECCPQCDNQFVDFVECFASNIEDKTPCSITCADGVGSGGGGGNSAGNSTTPPAATEDPYDFIDDEEDSGGSGNITDIVGPECEDVAIVYASCFFNNQAACLESCNTTASNLGAAEGTVGDVAAGATCADIQEPTCTFAECCPQCDDQFVDFVECFASNAGDKTPCSITCKISSVGVGGGGSNAPAGTQSPASNTTSTSGDASAVYYYITLVTALMVGVVAGYGIHHQRKKNEFRNHAARRDNNNNNNDEEASRVAPPTGGDGVAAASPRRDPPTEPRSVEAVVVAQPIQNATTPADYYEPDVKDQCRDVPVEDRNNDDEPPLASAAIVEDLSVARKAPDVTGIDV